MLKNPEIVQKWTASLSHLFADRSLIMERKYVAMDIQATVNDVSKNVNSEGPEVMPYGLEINWVKPTDRKTFIENGKIVVKLDHHRNQARNFVYAIMAYIAQGLLPRARRYVEKYVMRSSDLILAKKIFLTERKYDSLKFFYDEILDPQMEAEPKIKKYVDLIGKLDEMGFFTRILLREYWDIGRKIHPKPPSQEILRETKEFADFLKRLAEKKRGVDINPTFEGKRIRLSIVLIARPEVVGRMGIDPYTNWIKKCLEKEIYTIYVLAAGKVNTAVAKTIANYFERSEKIEKVAEQEIRPKGLPPRILILFKERM